MNWIAENCFIFTAIGLIVAIIQVPIESELFFNYYSECDNILSGNRYWFIIEALSKNRRIL